MIVTFYNEIIDPEIVKAQKSVFDHFDIPIKQIKPETWHGHGGTIDRWIHDVIDTVKSPLEPIIILDIDCIPLSRSVMEDAYDFCQKNFGIFSVAQKASHIPLSPVYAGPAFIAFNAGTYEILGRPTFACTDRADCAGELTYKARENGVPIFLLYPSHVEEPLWDLDGPFKFGKGTTYGGRIYHAFYSRKENKEMFLKKCKEIIHEKL